MNRALRTAGWFAGLLTVLYLLRSLDGPLGGPPLTSIGDASRWIDREGPAAAAVALVRHVAELAVWYLLVVSALHTLASLVRVAGAVRLAEVVTLSGTGRLVRAGLGVGLAASTTISTVPVAASSEPGEPGTAVMRPLDDSETPGPATTEPTERAPAQRDAGPPAMLHDGSALYTVSAGDSFWRIAEHVMRSAWGRTPAAHELDPYWRALVDTNRDRLMTPDDADLILPGQVFEIPPVPPPP